MGHWMYDLLNWADGMIDSLAIKFGIETWVCTLLFLFLPLVLGYLVRLLISFLLNTIPHVGTKKLKNPLGYYVDKLKETMGLYNTIVIYEDNGISKSYFLSEDNTVHIGASADEKLSKILAVSSHELGHAYVYNKGGFTSRFLLYNNYGCKLYVGLAIIFFLTFIQKIEMAVPAPYCMGIPMWTKAVICITTLFLLYTIVQVLASEFYASYKGIEMLIKCFKFSRNTLISMVAALFFAYLTYIIQIVTYIPYSLLRLVTILATLGKRDS